MIKPSSRLGGVAVAAFITVSLLATAESASASTPPAGDQTSPTRASDFANAQPLVRQNSSARSKLDQNGQSAAEAAVSGVSTADESKLYQGINAARLAECVPVLRRNADVDTVARNWSTTMANADDLWNNPNLEAEVPAGAVAGGELIAAGYPSGGSLLTDALADVEWRSLITEPTLTDVGIGWVNSSYSNTFEYPSYTTVDLLSYPEPATATFLDVRYWHQFYKEIEWMASTGISRGSACGTAKVFAPSDSTTRETMAAFLYRAAGSPAYTAPTTSPFVDVPTTRKFYKEISWLAASGISGGWTNSAGGKEFRPTLDITREAMAAFLYRLAGKPAVSLPATPLFIDVPTNRAFYTEITWMAQQGISTGYSTSSGKEFRPLVTTERAAMSAFLYRYKD